MNTHQANRRLKNVLRGMLWGGSGGALFGRDSVFCSGAPEDDLLDQIRLPAAWVQTGAMRHDDQNPGLYEADMDVVTLVSVPGDPYGEGALMGRNRTSVTDSDGRGLYEVESEMLGNLKHLDASLQFPIMLKAASSVLPIVVGDTGFHYARRYTFGTLLTVAAQHLHPRNVTLVDASGTVTIAWEAPDDPTNLVDYVVRRASGGVPVAFPGDGTDVPWSSGLSVTDTPGVGEWTYSVFARYDDAGGSWPGATSDFSDDTITLS